MFIFKPEIKEIAENKNFGAIGLDFTQQGIQFGDFSLFTGLIGGAEMDIGEKIDCQRAGF